MTAMELMQACYADDELCKLAGRVEQAGADRTLVVDLLAAICQKAEAVSDAERPTPRGLLR